MRGEIMTLPSNEVKTAETSLNIQRENILAKKYNY